MLGVALSMGWVLCWAQGLQKAEITYILARNKILHSGHVFPSTNFSLVLHTEASASNLLAGSKLGAFREMHCFPAKNTGTVKQATGRRLNFKQNLQALNECPSLHNWLSTREFRRHWGLEMPILKLITIHKHVFKKIIIWHYFGTWLKIAS